jgi:hypothetical protein
VVPRAVVVTGAMVAPLGWDGCRSGKGGGGVIAVSPIAWVGAGATPM